MAKYHSITDFRTSVQSRAESGQSTRFTQGRDGMTGAAIRCETKKDAVRMAARIHRLYDQVYVDGSDVKILQKIG